MREVVILGGVRTPFVKAGTDLRTVSAVELGRVALREALERTDVDPEDVDEVIVGTVSNPPEAANVARVIALSATLPRKVPAFTVGRNCASGLESIVEAAYRIQAGHADLVAVGAVESMSRIPFLFPDEAQEVYASAARARSLPGRVAAFARLRPRHFTPRVGLQLGLTDPVSGLNMGETAEVLARDFAIGREEQDSFALRSHQLAAAAWSEGRLPQEVVPLPLPPRYESAVDRDNGVRPGQSMEALGKLKPVFDRRYGTVTAGNASQITDGAVGLVVASAERARAMGAPVLARIRSWGFAGCDPSRMGLGPVLSTPVALRRAGGLGMAQMDLVELNEAFAVQVLACLRAFESRAFFEEHVGGAPVGAPAMDRLNVNGGAIALGHPVGASGARLVLTLCKELERRGGALGLATMCIGGGQGGSIVVERA